MTASKRAAARSVASPPGYAAAGPVAALLLMMGQASSSAMPMAFAGGDLLVSLRECGETPVRTVSCVGAQGSGKSTLMRSMFGVQAGEDGAAAGVGGAGLALLEARSDCAYSAETNDFRVGTGEAMVSLAVSDVMIYNVLVHDLTRVDALSDLQVWWCVSFYMHCNSPPSPTGYYRRPIRSIACTEYLLLFVRGLTLLFGELLHGLC